MSAHYRLGMPVYLSDGFCIACRQGNSDCYGNHAISCGSHGERLARHNHLLDAIFATTACAHFAPTKEDRALLPNSAGHPADVMIGNFCRGLQAALDISVINPLQAAMVHSAAVEPGYALRYRHKQKLSKYRDRCMAEGIQFCPVICETTGSWHGQAEQTLRRIGQALTRATGGDEKEVVSHMFGRLSVLLQRDNSMLLPNHVPTVTQPEVDRYL